MDRRATLQESRGIHVRVRQDMVDHDAEVLQCVLLDLEDAAVKGRVGSMRVGQDSAH